MNRTINLLVGALAMLFAATACNDSDGPKINRGVPLQLTPQEQQMAASANEFALDLFKTLNQGREAQNTLVSPYSAMQVLAMVANGADGATRQEIVDALRMGDNVDEINSYIEHLRTGLLKADPNSVLLSSNSIWLNKGLEPVELFKQNCATYYGASCKSIDFSSSKATDVINKWVSDGTKGMIPSMFSRIDPGAKLYALNATYFHGMWTNPFRLKRMHAFYNLDRKRERVAFMFEDFYFQHYDDTTGVSLLRLPYGNQCYEMDILIPNDKININDCIKSLTLGQINEMLDGASPSGHDDKYKVGLPMFETAFDYDMIKVFKSIGIKSAFSSSADLSKLIKATNVMLTEAKQTSKIKVNEEGTEVATVTTVKGDEMATITHNQFIVDSPFIYMIRECNSGAILFIGKMVSIKQTQQ